LDVANSPALTPCWKISRPASGYVLRNTGKSRFRFLGFAVVNTGYTKA